MYLTLEEYRKHLGDETLTEEQIIANYCQEKEKFNNEVDKIVNYFKYESIIKKGKKAEISSFKVIKITVIMSFNSLFFSHTSSYIISHITKSSLAL